MDDPQQLKALFADLPPTPQDDGPNPLVPIAYPSSYVTLMSLFRSVCQKLEYSSRAIQLTSLILPLNPGHYTVWKHRLDCVLHLGLDAGTLCSELEFVELMCTDNLKCYQVWHHRQALISQASSGVANPQSYTSEIAFVDRMLTLDSKNYHAWAYRQFLVQKFKMFRNEMTDSEIWIRADVRNNSAWNQRYFCLNMLKNQHESSNAQNEANESELFDFVKEVSVVEGYINQAPNNQAPWNYLAGIKTLSSKVSTESIIKQTNQIIETLVLDLLSISTPAKVMHLSILAANKSHKLYQHVFFFNADMQRSANG